MKLKKKFGFSHFIFLFSFLAGSFLLLEFLVVSLCRISYPFDLEWMEGATADHIIRILQGKPLYISPSPFFIPFIYPPFYYYVGAVFSKLLGVNLFSLRLLSFLSTLGIFYLLFLYVYKKTGDKKPAFISLFLYAATFPLSGFWFDVARVDSFFLFLLFLSFYLLDLHPKKWGQTLAGLVLTAAALTKQSAIGAYLLFAPLLLLRRRKTLPFVLSGGLGISLSYLFLQIFSKGWFFYYVFYLPSKHPLRKEMFINFWKSELFSALPVAFTFAVLTAAAILISRDRQNYNLSLIFIVFILLSWASMIHSGSFKNDMMPAYLAISALSGLAYKYLFEGKNLNSIFFLAALFQFLLLLYNPLPQIPEKRDRLAGKKILKVIVSLKGDVFVPFHGQLKYMAKKPAPNAHIMAIEDVRRADPFRYERLEKMLCEMFKNHHFAAVILDAPLRQGKLQSCIEKYYKRQRLKVAGKKAFKTKVGLPVKPTFLFLPKR